MKLIYSYCLITLAEAVNVKSQKQEEEGPIKPKGLQNVFISASVRALVMRETFIVPAAMMNFFSDSHDVCAEAVVALVPLSELNCSGE